MLASIAGLVALGLVVTRVAGASTEVVIDLDPSGPYRLRSSAGPVEISQGPSPRLDYRASWLGPGPELVTSGRSDEPLILLGQVPSRLRSAVEVSCDSRLPCRAALAAELPSGVAIEAVATGGPVFVERFDGIASVTTSGDHEVVLGPVEGTIRATSERGDITGHGLAADRVEVVTDGGEVELSFARRPRSVVVEAGDRPVVIVLPAGRYAVTVGGDQPATIEVEQDETADSRISIAGRGPVRIGQAPSSAPPLDRPVPPQRP